MAKKFIDTDILFKNIVDHHYLMVSSSNSTDYGMFTVGIKQAIDECPAADVQEVKHGRWSETSEHIILAIGEAKDWVNYYCSECDAPNDTPTSYCPHCGARMDGDKR